MISVIIPTHDRPQYLIRAIKSVLRQSHQDFEILVVDDASRINVREVILQAEICNLGKIDIVRTATNSGPANARNVGISKASGQIVAFLDDDELSDGYLANLAQLYSRGATCSWSSVAYNFYNLCGFVARKEILYSDSWSQIKKTLHFLQIGVGHGFACKRSLFDEVGFFDSTLRVVEDTEFFLRLIRSNIPLTINESVGIEIHHHLSDRLTAPKFENLRRAEKQSIIHKYRDFLKTKPEIDIFLRNDDANISASNLSSLQVF